MKPPPSQNNTLPITIARLEKWGGMQVLREARNIVEQGLVLQAEYDAPYIKGTLLQNHREFKTALRILRDGNAESECPCYANREKGMICSHVIALGLWLASRSADPARERKIKAEQQQADRIAAIDESCFIKRAPQGTPGSIPAAIHIAIDPAWIDGIRADAIPFCVMVHAGERAIAIDQIPASTVLGLTKADENLLFALEDIAGGPVPANMSVSRRDWISLLACRAGESFDDETGNPIQVHEQKVESQVALDIHPETGELRLSIATVPPFLPPGDEPVYIIDSHTGWVYAADHFWPLAHVLPQPYQNTYQQSLMIPRSETLRFLRGEAPLLQRKVGLASNISLDLFTIEPARPTYHLAVQGSPASLAATLYASYEDLTLVAAKPDKQEHFSIPDPDDLLRYTVRNPAAEREALQALRQWKLAGETGDSLTPIVGTREVLTFLGAAVPALRRDGWRITLTGRVEPFYESLSFATPVVHVQTLDDDRWFDVSFDFEDTQGASIKAADVHNALRKGEAAIEQNGRVVLIDTTAVTDMLEVFDDCGTSQDGAPGCFRLSAVYAPYVEASLRALDAVDMEAEPLWLKQAELANRLQPPGEAPIPAHLQTTLRPYQRDGVQWLYNLEHRGFSGLLADEMGLGKTLQTLTWLQMERVSPDAGKSPALIVCPTSLVQNWIEEAARFAPALRTCAIAGNQRQDLWASASEKDMIVISYALLRRDIEQCMEHRFAAVILDEAQHIKNHNTRNAQAAKQIRAHNRLVLTGTPVENSVLDIWSIMDFLMPGYLGDHQQFRLRYELPIAHGGPEAQAQQAKLRRKLHPFLLRRLKKDVAKDLPPKLERIATCELSPDQKLVYRELLERSRRQITDLVSAKGFSQARLQILATLLRLRQACCHLDLLKMPSLQAEQPSAKMDLFMELMDEAIDGGHRILVFSQFVSMLHIIRNTLNERGIRYCYLDGNTKDRMQQVHLFNTSREIPLFLISLKAGGTGLNLTGADMVIHYDPWWNPAVENQATDRAYRIGQKRTVYSVKLITTNTVEEKVLAMQKRKQAVIQATVENAASTLPDTLSWDDIQDLLAE
ncbi:MAG: DEAD/DEAH box helicase [Kiritimatiellia bacterium]